MKKLFKILLVIVSISFINCDNSESNDSTNPPNNGKLIHKINNGEKAVFMYEGDKIMKGIGNAGLNVFQVEYENNKVKKVYEANYIYPSFTHPFDFNFDLTDGSYPELLVWDYNYSNNKLTSISINGFNLYSFNYDSNGRIIEEIQSIVGYGLANKTTKFFYDNNGKINSYIQIEGNTIKSGLFLTDSFINPIYILWNKYNFVFPPDYASITNFNERYFPNNTIGIYNGEQVVETATMTYDNDNYPILYNRFSNVEIIEYLE